MKAAPIIDRLLGAVLQGALGCGIVLGVRALLGYDDLWLVAWWAGIGGAAGYWNGKG